MIKNKNMSLVEAIKKRRSVRGFKPDAVPQSDIDEILQLAQLAPSNCNTQPWRVFMASGDQCNTIRQQIHEAFTQGKTMQPDFSSLPKFEGVLRDRQIACAQALYGAMGIERGDKNGRMQATARNYQFFDAPHIIFIGMEKNFSPAIAVDVGMYAQNLMLLMTAYGIASCAQASLAYYPEIVRSFFDEDDSTGILFGISFGYEDETVDANAARTNRATTAEVVKKR